MCRHGPKNDPRVRSLERRDGRKAATTSHRDCSVDEPRRRGLRDAHRAHHTNGPIHDPRGCPLDARHGLRATANDSDRPVHHPRVRSLEGRDGLHASHDGPNDRHRAVHQPRTRPLQDGHRGETAASSGSGHEQLARRVHASEVEVHAVVTDDGDALGVRCPLVLLPGQVRSAVSCLGAADGHGRFRPGASASPTRRRTPRGPPPGCHTP
jgi:hypothetical protein